MKNTAQVRVNLINKAQSISTPGLGVMFMVGETLKGPLKDPKDLISSKSQFERIYGPANNSDDFALVCLQALSTGALLRVSRVAGAAADVAETEDILSNEAGFTLVSLFRLVVKVPGPEGNNYIMRVTPPGSSGSFTIEILDQNLDVLETFPDLEITGWGTAGPYTYLADIVADSLIVDVEYEDLSALSSAPTLWNDSLFAFSQGFGSVPAFAQMQGTIGVPSSSLFRLVAKGLGALANDYTVAVTAGKGNLFNIQIHDPVTGFSEIYTNLEVSEAGKAGPYTYLKDIVNNSVLVDVEYEDISALSAIPTVVVGNYEFTGGADYAANLADYVQGFAAFNDYDEAYIISAPGKDEVSLVGLAAEGKNYAAARKDLIYLQSVSNTLATASAIKTAMDALSITSKYVGFIGGGIKVNDLLAGGLKNMTALGPVLGNIAAIHQTLGIWRNPTNYAAGRLGIANGVVRNFGGAASIADLNLLAQSGANMVVNKGGTIMLWDFYSMDLPNSPDKFLSVVLLQMYMIKILKPTLEGFLGMPNTFSTFQAIYQRVRPFLDSLVSQEALVEYKWDGDQFATSLADLQVNTPTEIGQGRYKIQLQIKVVVPMVDITLNIVMTENSVEFE
jgi:phage tail sheath protein FI